MYSPPTGLAIETCGQTLSSSPRDAASRSRQETNPRGEFGAPATRAGPHGSPCRVGRHQPNAPIHCCQPDALVSRRTTLRGEGSQRPVVAQTHPHHRRGREAARGPSSWVPAQSTRSCRSTVPARTRRRSGSLPGEAKQMHTTTKRLGHPPFRPTHHLMMPTHSLLYGAIEWPRHEIFLVQHVCKHRCQLLPLHP